ncbi:MAG: hypothetical protein IPQ13_06495 [Holophagaceae bacterium]|nr:hypothetical protein [Holophagaceae bacterium]
MNRRTSRFINLPWMDRLAVAVGFDLVVNWALLGMAFRHVHNAWLTDFAMVPQVLLSLWVLSGLGPRPIPPRILATAVVAFLGSATLEASLIGFGRKWPVTLILASLILLGFCLWRLKDLIAQPEGETVYRQPAFWLLGGWVLGQGMHLTFIPLADLFLKSLPKAWILVPWIITYFLGLSLNLVLSKAFLCRKSAWS